VWFAIGGSHVSDRLPRPRHQRREEMLQEGGEDILIQDYEEHEFNKIISISLTLTN